MEENNYINEQTQKNLQKNKKRGKVTGWIAVSVFMVVGVILIITGVYYLNASLKTAKWPSTDGKILTSKIALYYSGSGRNKSSSYNLEISYAYAVDGQGYTGRKISMVDFGTGFKGYLKNLQNKYCIGTNVKVFYNPQDPENAVLEPGIKMANGFFFALGLFFIMCDLPFLLAGIKKTNKFRKYIKYFAFVISALSLVVFLPLVGDLIWNSYFVKTVACAEPKSSVESRYDQCPLLTGQEERDSCYFGVAGTSLWKDSTICDKISDNSQYKGACFSMVAQRLNDFTLCDKIPDGFSTGQGFYTNQTIKDQCYYYFKTKN